MAPRKRCHEERSSLIPQASREVRRSSEVNRLLEAQ